MKIVKISIDSIKTKKSAESIVGGLSNPSKMPGKAFGIPAAECKTGAKLRKVPGSVCSDCYACKGRYGFNNVQDAQYRRFDLLKQALRDPAAAEVWVSAMIKLIDGQKFFRIHDSGDLQNEKHLDLWVRIARELPEVKFWIPTKEKGIISKWVKNNAIPDNVNIRLSGAMIDGDIPSTPRGVNSSTVHKNRNTLGYECLAYTRGGECGDCRACWDKSIGNVSYPKH